MSWGTRLEKLEAEGRSGVPIVIWQHYEETSQAAVARWKRNHPRQDPDATGLRVMIIKWSNPGQEQPS
jgi:hypothetical protein